ncbi:hypothetical protein C7S20_12480 [Christiangramia fulva]|uniref:Uncharacterized protein n=1 Tax=Christiangramia fulva TaxID=2126553 RepID=A0A2R3Z6Z7_9FLAO|nr:hypothetical protein [Christiangramia fulva]AVR46004.1 hypothetical protein C7S20_12480 [Christiangramia fulva]
MKLIIVTALHEFQKQVLKIFREANIEAFSSSEIDGYKTTNSLVTTQSWFPGEQGGNESSMFFSFTEEEKVKKLFELLRKFNSGLKTDNPVRAIVLNVEEHI